MTFDQAMRLAGLLPREIVPDGKWRRCPTEDHPKTRNGAYILHPDNRGYYRNWAVHEAPIEWRDGNAGAARPVDPAILQAHKDRRRAERIQGVRWARELWDKATPYTPHAYLLSKGLDTAGCNNFRQWTGAIWLDEKTRLEDTWLLVPLFWRGKLVNVQRISSTGVKRQMKNAPQTGCCLILDRPQHAVTVFAKGLATGLAVYQSMRNARVVVAFFADNILPVTKELNPTGSVVYAADNDWQTKLRRGTNPGIEKATNAAELIGAGVAWPTGIEGTDWADYKKEIGEGADRKIERLILGKMKYVSGVTI